MIKFKLSTKEKRFLIVWLGVCFFAFFVNFAGVYTEYDINRKLFTSGWDESQFWPFVTFNTNVEVNEKYGLFTPMIGFNGIFKSFNLPEFITYSLLGVGIVIVPKIW
jgi:hypothetical protein